MSASNHAPHQHQHQQHQHLEALSNSVSSTPSSSVQPPELAAQQDMMVTTINSDPNMHGGMGHNDVSMDNNEYHPAHSNEGSTSNPSPEKSSKEGKSKDKRERLSRACVACHTGKTRCSDNLPCQSCIKRGIANTCAYPDPLDGPAGNGAGSVTSEVPAPRSRRSQHSVTATTPAQPSGPGQGVFSATPQVRGFFYDTPPPPPGGTYVPAVSNPVPGTGATNGVMAPASASAGPMAIRRDPSPSGRPSKKARYRNLSEQELASFNVKPYKRGTFFVGDSAPVSIDPRLPLRLLLADEERVDFFVGDGLPP